MKIKRWSIWIIVIVFFLFLISLFGDQGFISLYRSHQQITRLSGEIQQSHIIIDSLSNEIKRLKSDTAYIERIAREKLGMARRNEKIYKFVKESQ